MMHCLLLWTFLSNLVLLRMRGLRVLSVLCKLSLRIFFTHSSKFWSIVAIGSPCQEVS